MSSRAGDFSPPIKGGYTADSAYHRRNWRGLSDYLRSRHIASGQLAPGAVDSAALADGSVTSDKIDSVIADKIASGTLFASVVVAGLIQAVQAAGDTARLNVDPGGLTLYDSAGNVLCSLPTVGDPFYHGAMEATQLDILDRMTIRGQNNFMDAGAYIVMKGSQQDPPSAPSVAVGWEKLTLANSTGDRRGMFYDSAGGAGGSTPSFLCTEVSGTNGYLREFNASTGALLRTYTFPSWQLPVGVARIPSGDIFALVYNEFSPTNWFLQRIDQSSFATEQVINVTTIVNVASKTGQPCIGYDATAGQLMICVPTVGGANATISRVNTSGQVQSTVQCEWVLGGTAQDLAGIVRMTEDSNDFFWIALKTSGTTRAPGMYAFSTGGTLQTVSSYHFVSEGAPQGLAWDGTRFWTHTGSGAELVKHSTWRWTTASSSYFAGYTWMDDVDSNGRDTGDFESGLSAEQSFTMKKRARVTVTSPAKPTGVTHVPKYLRISTDASQNLQSDSANETTVLTDYNASGAAIGSGGVGVFPASTNSEFRTDTDIPLVRANGIPRLRVTSGTPTANQPVADDTDEVCDWVNASVTEDTEGAAQAANDRIQWPYAAMLLVIGTAQWPSGNGANYREIHVEHSTDGSAWSDLSSQGLVSRVRALPTSTNGHAVVGTVIVDTDDYLRLVVHHTDGAGLNLTRWTLHVVQLGPA